MKKETYTFDEIHKLTTRHALLFSHHERDNDILVKYTVSLLSHIKNNGDEDLEE